MHLDQNSGIKSRNLDSQWQNFKLLGYIVVYLFMFELSF